MAKAVYRGIATNEQAIQLGYPNVQSYRLAVRQEQAREERLAYADAVGRRNAELAKQLQTQGPLHIFRTSPLTQQQEAAARARNADRAGRGDGQ
jgi:hypothetical protein